MSGDTTGTASNETASAEPAAPLAAELAPELATVSAVGVTLDCADPNAQADFWQAAIGFTQRVGDGNPYITLSAAPGKRAINHLTLQRVPEPKSAKHRAHLDLFVRDREAEVTRLTALGATVIGFDGPPDPALFDDHDADARDQTDGSKPPTGGHLGFVATVMADPEGGEFCVVSRPKK